MSDPVANTTMTESPVDWASANQSYIEAQMERLRLLLRLRAIKLRKRWQRELAQVPSGFQALVISDAEADALLRPEAEEDPAQLSSEDAREILDELDEQERRIQEARVNCPEGTPPAFEILSRLFRLGRLEQDILLLCLAPEVDSRFERLFAYLQDDVARIYATASLAQDVFATPLASEYGAIMIRAALSPHNALRLYRLLNPDANLTSSWGHEPLHLDRRIGDYILGINQPDEQLAALVRPETGPANLDSASHELVRQLDLRLRAWANPQLHPLVQLVGAPGCSPRTIGQELCSQLGLTLYSVDPSRLPQRPAERQAIYRLLERESLLLTCGYFLDCSQIDRNDSSGMNGLRELLQDLRALLIIATREPLALERSQIMVRLPNPNAQSRGELWHRELQDTGASETAPDKALGQFNFDARQIRSVVATAHEAARLRDPENPSLTAGDLWRAARDQASRSMQGLADKIELRRSLQDLILPPQQIQQLQEIALQVAHRAHVYEDWGFGAKMNRGKGISALFSGPSGTGKTMAAEVLAGYLDLDLYRIDLAGVVSKYIGETEKNLRRLFDAAEESGAILFFDEADALFGKRSEVRDSHDRYANIEINYLLQRMEEYRGLAILATNRKSLLDSAFLRRLRFLVEFPFPATADRLRIWKSIFPEQARVDGIDYEFLARLEVAGGNISNIALNAAFRASSEGSAVTMHHVLSAARREYDKIDKMVLESEFGRYYAVVRR